MYMQVESRYSDICRNKNNWSNILIVKCYVIIARILSIEKAHVEDIYWNDKNAFNIRYLLAIQCKRIYCIYLIEI